MKNYLSALRGLLVMLCCLVGFGFMANTQASVKAKKSSYLFVLSAKKGMLQASGKGHTLTLTGLDPHVLWFTDRPNRKAGYVPTQQFIANWAKGFKGGPPNAGLVHVDMSYTRGGRQAPMAVELINPSMSEGVLQFDVKGLGEAVAIRRLNMSQVSLFVDREACFPGFGLDPCFNVGNN